ncbi:hypothetical protein N185_17565 [Sinorhizobium sp. GW3]|nr:hypothetical protein N185_17565 [Sinorhizobium sp. GW3]
MLVAVLGLGVAQSPAIAETYDTAVIGLVRASYKHMRLAYSCRDFGSSTYLDARIATEIALRATGLPTILAVAVTAEIASEIRFDEGFAAVSLADCTVGLSRTRKAVATWRERVLRIQR